jgi:vacuolar-type H+-ATPase subunit H
LRKIETATKAYGDAGFNTADMIDALANQQDKFYTKIGAAINASEQWQKAFTSLTDAVVEFVNNLDPDFVTDFTDAVVEKAVWATGKLRKVLADFYSYFYDTISDFAKVIRDNPMLYDFLGYDIEYWSKLDASMMRVRRQIDGTTTALKEARSAAQKDLNDAIVKDAERQFKAFNDTGREINDETKKIIDSFSKQTESVFEDLDEIETSLNRPTDIIQRQGQPQNQGTVQDMLTQANWPAEFAALGEFMFKWVLSVASGSSFPMAVTTAQ